MIGVRLLTAIVSAIFLLIVGTVMRHAELYFMSAALLSVPFISYGIAKLAIRRLSFTREVPEYAFEGEFFPMKVSMTGDSNLLGPIEITDNLPPWIQTDPEARNIIVGSSSGPSSTTYTALATKRGIYKLESIRLGVSDPLGFFLFRSNFKTSSSVVVLPSPLKVTGVRPSASDAFAEFAFGTVDGSGSKGNGLDFHGVREYQVGDELRRVHWASTARHGRLNVIEFESPKLQDVVIAIDRQKGTERGTGRFTTLEYAVKISAGLIEDALSSGATVRLVGTGADEASATATIGRIQMHRMLEILAGVNADGDHSLEEILMSQASTFQRGVTVTCFVSSISDGLIRAASFLSSRGIGLRIVLLSVESGLTGIQAEVSAEKLQREIGGGAAALNSAGASLIVVQCSNMRMESQVKYEYAG